jgi:tetratricopeptide (TPR) repeat protein
MTHNELTYQQIEAYLNEEMSPEERAAFEQQMEQDAALAQTVALHREMNVQYHERDWAFLSSGKPTDQEAFRRFFESEEAKALKEALEEAENPSAGTKVRTLGRRNWLLLAAAAVGLLILVIGLWPRSSSPESLYRQYAQHNPLQLTQKGVEEEWLTNFENAFNAGFYEEALGLVAANQETDTLDYAVQLAIGISHLEQQQYDQAGRVFEQIAASDALLSYEGLWYLALTELKNGNEEGCRQKLEQIMAEENHPRREEARRLWGEL